MKNLKTYLLSAVIILLFSCCVMGVKAEAALTRVTGIKETESGPDNVILEWTAVLGSDVDYQVEISADGSNWQMKKDSTGAQPHTSLDGLSSGSTYYVRILAYTEVLDWDTGVTTRTEAPAYSEVYECVTSPSGDPEYLHKTNSTTTSISLEWGEVEGANAYVVKYAPRDSSAGEQSITVTTNTAKLTKLRKNTEYNVTVHGVRKTSDGSYTTESGGDSSIFEIGFGVTPSKLTGVDIECYWYSLSKMDVICDVIPCADGYEAQVWTAYKKKDTKIASAECDYNTKISGITTTYLEKPILEKLNFFKVRMRAYSVTNDGTKKYGAWSDWRYVSRQPEVTKIKVSKNGMKLTWDKINGADRYTIYASLKKKSGYKKVATTKKTSYTMKKFNKKKLKKGKTYYFYIEAENKVGKKYYSGEAKGASEERWSKKNKY